MKNPIGHEIPEQIANELGLGIYGVDKDPRVAEKDTTPLVEREYTNNKVVESIEEAIKMCGLKDGMTISFHHHFRNGDQVLNQVMEVIARMGFKDLKVASSSLNSVHAPLIEHIKSGVVRKIETSGCRGHLADEISRGLMEKPVIFRSHGGRAAAIADGKLHIDVAFLGAPCSDTYGNASGVCLDEEMQAKVSECGSLGYAKVDAQYADKVVIVTDTIVEYPNAVQSIEGTLVTCVVKVDSIGDPSKISAGATRFTKNPRDLMIAESAAKVIINSGYFNNGMSIQTGTGGASLAVTRFLADTMKAKGITARFALGGITGQMVKLHEQGLIETLWDVQDFDTEAAASLRRNPGHHEVDGLLYATPFDRASILNQLDIVVLSALEIDVNFNVNVLTGSDGVIRGAIGGHPDTAKGADLTVIVTPLIRGRIPCVRDKVGTICTDGQYCDVLVTDVGIAVNPKRPEIKERLLAAGLKVYDINELKEMAEKVVGKPDALQFTERIVGVVTAPDGTILDLIYGVVD